MNYNAIDVDVMMMSIVGTNKYDFIRALDPTAYSNWVHFALMKFICVHTNMKYNEIEIKIEEVKKGLNSLQKSLINYMEVFYNIDKMDIRQLTFVLKIADYLPVFLDILKEEADTKFIKVNDNNMTLRQTLEFLEKSRVED